MPNQEMWVQFPGWERSPGGGNGNPLQYSYRENLMHRGACLAAVEGVKKNRTWLKQLSTHMAMQNKVVCITSTWIHICMCVCARLFLYKNLWSNNMIGKLFWIVFWQKEGEIQMWPGNVNEVDEMLITYTNLETMSSFFCYFIPEILSFTVSFSWCDIIYPVSS